MIYSKLIGCGHYLPKKIMDNDDISKIVDTNDEWITSRTGITQRHIAEKDELTSDLAVEASKLALKTSDIKKIDCIICATTTPDRTFPATACSIQKKLGFSDIPAFDIQAVCSGFIYALHIADSMIKSQQIDNALVIGSETLSKIVDWTDRRTCVLFGDGAGAIILKSEKNSRGILASNIFSDGSWENSLFADGGVSLNQKVGKIRMKGQDIFKQAVNKLSSCTLKSLNDCKKTIDDISWFIPHQANMRIIDFTAKKLGFTQKKIIKTVNIHANTSSASIPLALSSSIHNNIIKKKDLLALCAIGGGLTWGSCIVEY